ncbi:MAG TPA: multicopper oxidase domain-containing protein [Candidatus Cybelea sp.]|jgi:hephaestin|nr:multicopper oxidase domain-containing protein [Candidatus Cybelea sp.]
MLRIICLIALCTAPAVAAERTYYIAADEIVWNYAPSGTNVLTGAPLAPNKLQLGYRYRKIVYRGYSDASFRMPEERAADERYMGTLGPPIRAVVGDTVTVVFRNNSHLPLSFHVHGLRYLKTSEGAPYRDGTGQSEKPGDAVAPGATYTYRFEVPERSGPGPMDPSSILWMYHSHTDELRDVNTGLVGPIVVTRRGSARTDGTPNDVDREVFTMFAQIDESQSRLFAENLADPTINPHGVKTTDNQNFVDANSMFSINGFVFGNMPMIDVVQGQRTRWYVMTTMSDFDFHAPHWHGETVIINGMRTDTAQLGPMGMVVADMVPDNPGVWLYHCHLNVHLEAGMAARFRTLPVAAQGARP